MLDYERNGQEWNKIIRSSAGDWNKNVETVIEWSPFSNEAELLRQFNQMKDHGTTIIIYNLWEDDQGLLELDFETDPHDIQIRGVNRDERNIQMARQFPNSRHFLTYKHSLRSYASILYLRIPPGFRVILRGKDVERHNIVNDMMFTQEVTYRPQTGADGVVKDSSMVATVIVGFVKDARSHIDVQGFNVYHKNRLIKPFWRVWNASGSDGRGVIGVLEANFVEPAHDKQGFERTIVLSRLETKLVQMQKTYWSTHCHKIGYAPRGRNKSNMEEEPFPEHRPQSEKKSATSSKTPLSTSDKFTSQGRKESDRYPKTVEKTKNNRDSYGKKGNKSNTPRKSRISPASSETSSSSDEDINGDDDSHAPSPHLQANGNSQKASAFVSPTNVEVDLPSRGQGVHIISNLQSKGKDASGNGMAASPSDSISPVLQQLKEQNRELRERLNRTEDEILGDLLNDLQQEKDRSKSLNAQIKEANEKIEELNKEQESLINIFSEERERRDMEEENLRKKLREASSMIQQLVDKVKLLEKSKHSN